jgi:hypothetical protein
MDELNGRHRMMREMAQQIRVLIAERSTPITRRMRELPSQLEQEADVLEMETLRPRCGIGSGLIRSDIGHE